MIIRGKIKRQNLKQIKTNKIIINIRRKKHRLFNLVDERGGNLCTLINEFS